MADGPPAHVWFRTLDGWLAVTGWFLFLSYLLGSPAYALAEFQAGIFSERFAYPPWFIYLIGATQLASALLLLARRTAPLALLVLTVISIGAVASHLRIGSPLTAIPALGYTALQVWFGLQTYRGSVHSG